MTASSQMRSAEKAPTPGLAQLREAQLRDTQQSDVESPSNRFRRTAQSLEEERRVELASLDKQIAEACQLLCDLRTERERLFNEGFIPSLERGDIGAADAKY